MVQSLSRERDICEYRPLTFPIEPATRELWHAVLRRIPHAPVFMHPTWIELAAQCGVIQQAGLLIARHADEPIAIIPVRQKFPGLWEALAPFCMTGAAIAIDPNFADAAWAQVATWLRSRNGIGQLDVDFSNLPPPTETLDMLLRTGGMAVLSQATQPSQQVPLAASWEIFVQGRGRSTRRKLNTLDARIHGNVAELTVELVTEETGVAEAVDTLIRLYRQRWANQIGGSPLCASNNAAFLHAIMRWVVRKGYGFIPIIRYQGRPVALGTVLAMPGQSTAYYHFTARDTTCELPALVNSPGTALVVVVVQWAIEHGYAFLNMGRGNNHYKQLLGGQSFPHGRLSLATSPFAAAVLPKIARVTHLLRRLPLHLCYHAERFFRKTQACAEDVVEE